MRTMLDQGFHHRRDGHSPHTPATASYCARTALVACQCVRTPLMTCPSAAPPACRHTLRPVGARSHASFLCFYVSMLLCYYVTSNPWVRAVTQVSAGGVY